MWVSVHSSIYLYILDFSCAGIEMFYRRAQELSSLGEEEAKGVTKHVKDLFEAKKEAILSSEDKVVLAETLREVETEKQLASEER